MKPEEPIIKLIRNLHADRNLSAKEVIRALEEISCEADALCDALKEETED